MPVMAPSSPPGGTTTRGNSGGRHAAQQGEAQARACREVAIAGAVGQPSLDVDCCTYMRGRTYRSGKGPRVTPSIHTPHPADRTGTEDRFPKIDPLSLR